MNAWRRAEICGVTKRSRNLADCSVDLRRQDPGKPESNKCHWMLHWRQSTRQCWLHRKGFAAVDHTDDPPPLFHRTVVVNEAKVVTAAYDSVPLGTSPNP